MCNVFSEKLSLSQNWLIFITICAVKILYQKNEACFPFVQHTHTRTRKSAVAEQVEFSEDAYKFASVQNLVKSQTLLNSLFSSCLE